MSDADILRRLQDESEIRALTGRFGDVLMRADFDHFTKLWTDDPEWSIGAPADLHVEGTDGVVALFRQFWEGNEAFTHFAAQSVIAIDGDAAEAHCLCFETATGPDRFYRTTGVWSDRLHRTADGWRFASRSYQYLWIDGAPFTGNTFRFEAPAI